MSYTRPDALSYWRDARVQIRNHDELNLVLDCPEPIGDHESISFAGLRWDDDADGVIATSDFVADAAHQVVARGILPASTHELPLLGARVETIEIGGRPSPECRYGVGTVTSLSWDRTFQSWRVHVEFDRCTGGWQGYPIYATSTFSWMVHVIGGDERPFSDMSPAEIEALYRTRQSQQPKPRLLTEESTLRSTETSSKRRPQTAGRGDLARMRKNAGTLNIWSQRDLDRLLTRSPRFAVRNTVNFTGRLGGFDVTVEGRWVADAIAQVVVAGVLPAPASQLPTYGTKVETICLANRQNPGYGWAVGSVDWITWGDGSWRVSMKFDPRLEMKRGGRLPNSSCPLSMVRVIHGSERPFSDMGPDEIKELFERLREET